MLKAGGDRRQLHLGDDRPPVVPWCDTVIYEVHVRGSACWPHDLRPNERGTFARWAIPHSSITCGGLGVTTVELLPVPRLRAGPLSAAKGLRTTGATTHRLLHARSRAISPIIRWTNAHRRPPPACRRPRVILDGRSTITPRGQRAWPDVSLPRSRQCEYYRLAATIRAIASTTPALATRSISPRRAVLQMVMDSLR